MPSIKYCFFLLFVFFLMSCKNTERPLGIPQGHQNIPQPHQSIQDSRDIASPQVSGGKDDNTFHVDYATGKYGQHLKDDNSDNHTTESITFKLPSQKDIKDLIKIYVLKRFEGKAKIDIIGENDIEINFNITNLKSEILDPKRSLWEQIQLIISINNDQTFKVFVDGNFAAGMGSREPYSEDFKSMQPKYSEEHRRYVEKLRTAIEKYLDDKINSKSSDGQTS